MKKFLSVFSSAALTLFLATAGVISGFAVEMPDDYSVEASAYAEQYGDTSSYEVIASENANYPKVTGFSNTADGTKEAGVRTRVRQSTGCMFIAAIRGSVSARAQSSTTPILRSTTAQRTSTL